MDSLCAELLCSERRGFDPSPAVTRAVTNVVCTLVFGTTYCHSDAELQEVLQYNNGIVETIARGGLVDIYPWMKVCLTETQTRNQLAHFEKKKGKKSFQLLKISVISKSFLTLCPEFETVPGI